MTNEKAECGRLTPAQPKVKRHRFTGEVVLSSLLASLPKPKSIPPFQAINLYDLGTTGLLDYCAGVSPFHPKEPLTGKPTREWRIKQACVVIESRFGMDTGARERFIAAAEKICAQKAGAL